MLGPSPDKTDSKPKRPTRPCDLHHTISTKTDFHWARAIGQRDEKAPLRIPQFEALIGVDFSGAAQAGRNAWLAELLPADHVTATNPPFRLQSLAPLGKLAKSDDRESVNRYLSDRITTQSTTFWGFDFPFGLPIELGLGNWDAQLELVTGFSGNAQEFGRMLVETTQQRLGSKHVRRLTDKETQTPFDCYHYRIIYQTFHGMRDVLAPIADQSNLCVLPFQSDRLRRRETTSVVVEACPSSTLKRLRLPYQNYKQTGNKPPEEKHLRTRRQILRELSKHVDISTHRRRVIMNNPGGDALDAVLAAIGSWQDVSNADPREIADHPRYPLEGRVYC